MLTLENLEIKEDAAKGTLRKTHATRISLKL